MGHEVVLYFFLSLPPVGAFILFAVSLQLHIMIKAPFPRSCSFLKGRFGQFYNTVILFLNQENISMLLFNPSSVVKQDDDGRYSKAVT